MHTVKWECVQSILNYLYKIQWNVKLFMSLVFSHCLTSAAVSFQSFGKKAVNEMSSGAASAISSCIACKSHWVITYNIIGLLFEK